MNTDLLTALQETDAIINQHGRAIAGADFIREPRHTEELHSGLLREGLPDQISIRWRRGWGIDVSLKIDFSKVTSRRDGMLWAMECELSWSSTGHSITSALSFAALVRDVTELAAILQANWDHYKVKAE